MGVEAGEAEAHGHYGHDLGIVEDVLADPKPTPQPDARRIGVWTPRGMDPDARRLAGDANARGGRDLKNRPWLMWQRRAVNWRIPTDAACPDLFGQRGERGARWVHTRRICEPRRRINME